MDIFFMILLTCVFLILCIIIFKIINHKSSLRKFSLPPGPIHIPLITNILFLTTSPSKLSPLLRNLHAKHGPIITLPIWSGPHIFITDPSLVHEALVQNGAVFADRPKQTRSSHHHQLNISSSSYGATWRILRRNLSSEMLHPSRLRSFSGLRKRVLNDLLNRLKQSSSSSSSSSSITTQSCSVKVIDHVHHAIFSLLVLMCFGDRVKEKQIEHIKHVQRTLVSSFNRFSVLNFFPAAISRVVFRQRWNDLLYLRKQQKLIFTELIAARKERIIMSRNRDNDDNDEGFNYCYVDTLLNLELPSRDDEKRKRKLDEDEIISLCSEFLSAGTDTTSTALEWVMANVAKNASVQSRVVDEIGRVIGIGGEKNKRIEESVKEEDVEKLVYLKAVILEGLRRHPPSHFVVPHGVTEDVVFNGYLVPKKGTVNFMVAEMGWDPNVWEEPMEFKPERFLTSKEVAYDVNGNNNNNNNNGKSNKVIKMMPFGAGRRICPAYNMAMLHLEYFVANLVWNFEWQVCDHVDLSEKQEFTVVMKHPLQASISHRILS